MTLRILRTLDEVTTFEREVHRQGKRLALVPTMGFLHAGHVSLMKEAGAMADVVAVSIFVNPTQFGPREDFARYPRDLEGDVEKCRQAGVSVVFAPEAAVMYPASAQTFVEVVELQKGLCGARRPGHFRGVATIVTKLFALFRPDVALFGEKDYQQLQIIKALAQDLNLGVQVVGSPTVREADGLAMSSRNAYLSADERQRALSLSRGLFEAQGLASTGVREVAALVDAVRRQLAQAEVREDYVELVDAKTLSPLTTLAAGQAGRLLVAGFLGNTRLIDNVSVGG